MLFQSQLIQTPNHNLKDLAFLSCIIPNDKIMYFLQINMKFIQITIVLSDFHLINIYKYGDI